MHVGRGYNSPWQKNLACNKNSFNDCLEAFLLGLNING